MIFGFFAGLLYGALLLAVIEVAVQFVAACWDRLFPASDQAWALGHGRWE